MANLTEKSKFEKMGILQPQLAYRWRLRVPGNIVTEDEHIHIAMQAVKVNLDYFNKTLELTLRQNANSTTLHEAIMRLMERDVIVLHVDSLDGTTADPNYILEFTCSPKSHKFAFDYEQSRNPVANHIIVLDIGNMVPYNRKMEEEAEELEKVEENVEMD